MKYLYPDDKINQELKNALRFFELNELGKSRVCARKAAGFALRYYLQTRNDFYPNSSPYETLEFAQKTNLFPEPIQRSIDHLLLKVNINYQFPDEIDLIEEANQIINYIQIITKDTMPKEIIMYGTRWCGDTKRAKKVFEKLSIGYQWIDIDQDKDGEAFVKETNNGFRSVPTILFPDGSIMVEPSELELEAKLLHQP